MTMRDRQTDRECLSQRTGRWKRREMGNTVAKKYTDKGGVHSMTETQLRTFFNHGAKIDYKKRKNIGSDASSKT